MINEEFFKDNEKNDLNRLQNFNNHTKLFDYIEPTTAKSCTDATGYTITKFGEKRKFNIELKNRNLNLLDDGRISGATSKGEFIDDTIFIESHKVSSLLLDMIDGLEPLYINFLCDGKIAIFNLSKLTKRPRSSKYMNILSRGYGKFEMAKREGLYLVDAAIYDENYNLIKKAGEEWKTKNYS